PVAAREDDPERAAILRRMADAEAGHRTRIEARLQSLGVAIPDPATVRLTLWTRLQIRFAPVERVLAWREALENREAEDLYRRPTGDPSTDGFLAQLRQDERSHALAGAVAAALSMAVGAYLAERSTAEVAAANIEGERKELEEHPEEEREELSLFYQLKGLEKVEADNLADKLSRDPEAMLGTLTS